MSWTSPNEIKAHLLRLWERGDLLRNTLGETSMFPLRIRVAGPNSAELAQSFGEVRAWFATLNAVQKTRIETRTVNHRIHGAQQVPHSIWIDDFDAALTIVGKRREAARFAELIALIQLRQPKLIEWLEKRPLQALALIDDWPRLLAVIDWIVQHPRSGIYVRQVDIAGVHSKFIEAHRQVLAQCLDLVLPSAAIQSSHVGIDRFAARYGFRDKPIRIRFRILDSALTLLPDNAYADITLDAPSFSALTIRLDDVFITENETNFLAFPPVKSAMVIFGSGYGWDALAQVVWFSQCRLHYWGDIDTHGFAILNQLRSRIANVDSFLMDMPTLMNHRAFWGVEKDQVVHELAHLTTSEQGVFNALRDNRLQDNLRLEQEVIGFETIRAALARIVSNEQR